MNSCHPSARDSLTTQFGKAVYAAFSASGMNVMRRSMATPEQDSGDITPTQRPAKPSHPEATTLEDLLLQEEETLSSTGDVSI